MKRWKMWRKKRRERREIKPIEGDPIDPIDGVKKDQALEILSVLHQRQIDRFNERRRLEWRLTFTLWAGLLVTANVVKDLDLSDEVRLVGAVLLGVVVLFHLGWEIVYVERGAPENRKSGIDLENRMRLAIGVDQSTGQGYLGWAAHWLQVVLTLLLAGLVYAAAAFGG